MRKFITQILVILGCVLLLYGCGDASEEMNRNHVIVEDF